MNWLHLAKNILKGNLMISVIVPAHIPTPQHHNLLLRALSSLEKQTFKNFEVICVFNGCYDDSHKIESSITSSFELDVRFIDMGSKASGAIARNLGIKNSKFDIIVQLDADDQYHPQKLEKQIDFFSKNQDCDFVGTLAADIMQDGR